MEKIAEACNYLLNSPTAKSTLNYISNRLSQSTIDKFQFGYFPDVSNLNILESILDPELLKSNKLLYTKTWCDSTGPHKVTISYFNDHPLILPLKDTYGKVIALTARSLLNDEERKINNVIKYKNTIFTKGNYLFGLFENKDYILKSDRVYIVEGQIDVIKCFENGIFNVVGLGSASMTNYQFSLISRYTNNIHLLLDNDEAGDKGRQIILNKFKDFANIKNVYLPKEFKDVDEFLSYNSCNSLDFVLK